jgi:hypothetical protein
MTEDRVTIDSILGWLAEAVEERKVIPPDRWIDAAHKLNVLQGELIADVCDRQQVVAQMKFDYMKSAPKINVSAAVAYIETTDAYRELRKREMQIKQIDEYIRLAKLKARLLDSERRGS